MKRPNIVSTPHRLACIRTYHSSGLHQFTVKQGDPIWREYAYNLRDDEPVSKDYIRKICKEADYIVFTWTH